MLTDVLVIFAFTVLLPCIIYGIFHEDELVEFESRFHGSKDQA